MAKSSALARLRSTYSAPSTSLRTASPLSHSSFDIARSFRLICARRSGHGMVQLADRLDPQLDRVAGFEETASSHAYARRGPREHEIARGERHARRQHRDLLGGVEDQLARVGILHQLAVHPQLDAQLMGIAEVARRNDPGPERAGAVEAFLAHPVVVEWRSRLGLFCLDCIRVPLIVPDALT